MVQSRLIAMLLSGSDIIALVGVVLTLLGVSGLSLWRMVTYINRVSNAFDARMAEMDTRRADNERRLHEKIEATANSLDGKYTSLRDNIDGVKEDYARRDDLSAAIIRVERASGETREAIASLAERMDHSVAKFAETVAGLAVQIAKGAAS